jgi:DNA-directed RNA polymerase beta' subunit
MVDQDTKEITSITFGVYSAQDILKKSVCEVFVSKVSLDENTDNSVYDGRMGTIQNDVLCLTCKQDVWKCPGHPGHIVLKKPVIHPLFFSHVILLLKCFCFKCHKFLLDDGHLKLNNLFIYRGKRRFLEIVAKLKKTPVCVHCVVVQPDYKLLTGEGSCQQIYQITGNQKKILDGEECLARFENIDDETVTMIGLDPRLAHPKNFVLTVFPVIPICCRPFVVSEGNVCDDDLTHQLVEIVKNNALVDKASKYYNNLLFRIQTYFNNSQKKAKHATTGRPIKGIKERIAGKEGQMRNNLLGKRTNQSGRTVIGPDPSIGMSTLVVPKSMADILTIPETVCTYNIKTIQALVDEGNARYLARDGKTLNIDMMRNFRGTILQHGDEIFSPSGHKKLVVDTKIVLCQGEQIFRNGVFLDNVQYPEIKKIPLKLGDVVHRKLRDGDVAMLNRQPTLHKGSMLAFYIKILPVKTLKINLAVAKPFNCDFDGDEMNIHIPQSLESVAELQMLSTPRECLINSQAGKPNMTIVQDSLTAAYLMSLEDPAARTMSRETFFRHLFAARGICHYTRFQEVAIEMYRRGYCYFNGIALLSCVLPRQFCFRDQEMIIEDGILLKGHLTKKYLGATNSSIIKYIYNELGKIECERFIDDIQFVCVSWITSRGFTINAQDCLRTKDVTSIITRCFVEAESFRRTVFDSRIREGKIIQSLSKAKDIGMKIAKEALGSQNNFVTTVNAGSKGDFFNIAQITGLLGQQTVLDGRIKPVLNNRTRAIPHFPLKDITMEDEYKSKGFITSSFERGLDPIEFFFHAMSGRKGVCDTAMATATSGYNMRRIVKLTEDITVQYDGTVRDLTGRRFQSMYGELGYDPTKLVRVDGKNQVCNVKNLVSRLEKELNQQ